MNDTHIAARSQIGVVAIGRNEGDRLKKCLLSAQGYGPVVYVDSGSTDESVEFAKSIGVHVVSLDMSREFTAARARNAGYRQLLQQAPMLEFVQFIDGDCELRAGWLENALQFMKCQPEYAVVCGRNREVEPEKNVFHRIADLEWKTPIGESRYCGGNAFVRVTSFQAEGGFREALVAGEEPELCVRLRRAGWKIRRIDEEMTLHDIQMTSFYQWWKRCARSGRAYVEGAVLHGRSPEFHWVKEVRSIVVWGFVVPLAAIGSAWPTGGYSTIAAMVLYALLVLKGTVHLVRSRHWSLFDSLLYSTHCVISKFPQMIGVMQFVRERVAKKGDSPKCRVSAGANC